ncbi:hypothetical protein C446_00911 [Halobiforma nitratireducens JCM 10879]|uniref:Uncharacterized protein n=1 Tax=Halobiforma nitratireducens JCM 10879 TaxID=1227454 RepID=M0MMB1_9EURY|nr:hypothetical protein C446_00911 [Halobiforma nitratireducens JCM 10879]
MVGYSFSPDSIVAAHADAFEPLERGKDREEKESRLNYALESWVSNADRDPVRARGRR